MAKIDPSFYTIRQLVELDACTRCGVCRLWCPTFAEKESLEAITPFKKIDTLRSFLRQQHSLLFKLLRRTEIDDEKLATFSEGVYDCTLCARCYEVCPVGIDMRALWIAMREQLVDGNLYPETFDLLRERVTNQYNISGEDNANRMIWTENMERIPKGLDRRKGAETVYFAGCVGALYPRVYSVPQSFVQILEHAGEDFTTMGGDEWCCGFPLEIAGMGTKVVELARHNVETVRTIGARRLVTTCPSCYHTWSHEYPRLLGEPLGFEVLHATELLADLIDQGKIELRGFRYPVTYHDPCDLGRTSGIYDAPRRIIQAIPGIEFSEMAENREMALCCGGGGDAEMADAELTAAVGKRRIEQAQETGAKVVISACQQCDRTLGEAARKNRIRVRAMDITEVVWQAMGN
jgi:heterodisulfide reductase subunit D